MLSGAIPVSRCTMVAAASAAMLRTLLMAEARVAVVPGEAFGSNTHFRLSYATSMKELERGLDRIRQFLAG